MTIPYPGNVSIQSPLIDVTTSPQVAFTCPTNLPHFIAGFAFTNRTAATVTVTFTITDGTVTVSFVNDVPPRDSLNGPAGNKFWLEPGYVLSIHASAGGSITALFSLESK